MDNVSNDSEINLFSFNYQIHFKFKVKLLVIFKLFVYLKYLILIKQLNWGLVFFIFSKIRLEKRIKIRRNIVFRRFKNYVFIFKIRLTFLWIIFHVMILKTLVRKTLSNLMYYSLICMSKIMWNSENVQFVNRNLIV